MLSDERGMRKILVAVWDMEMEGMVGGGKGGEMVP